MGRKPTPQPLNLVDSSNDLADDNSPHSLPGSSRAVSSSASQPYFAQHSAPLPNRPQTSIATARSPLGGPHQDRDNANIPSYPSISAALDSPSTSSQSGSARHEPRKPSRSGFFGFKSRTASQDPLPPPNRSFVQRDLPASRDGEETGQGRQYQNSELASNDHGLQAPKPPFTSSSQVSLSSADDQDGSTTGSSVSKKGRSKTFGILGRSKSNRDKDRNNSPRASPTPLPATPSIPILPDSAAPLRTAPIPAHDRSHRDMMGSSIRNQSEDRSLGREPLSARDAIQSSSLKEGSGSTFLSGLRSSSTRAADIFSKGFFGKSSRSGSTTTKELVVDDENYVLKVINLPLVEQTRKTRISKRLESSRDKTEFWMPAFPWRAIDYLNYKGCDVEGLYRVPGSGPQIKKYQRKFDEQFDVNLFEEEDLYDINIIGSMLKAWLRELPDELFPKEAQERVARECAGAEEVPQMLIDELSNLSPFNYYLLFAITCHLSLLLAHSEKNKMDFRNLCICFQPCMKIDAFSFKFLVCDWRNCWKGCKNEAKYIEDEYKLFDAPPPRGLSDQPQRPAATFYSSDSSKISGEQNRDGPPRTPVEYKPLGFTGEMSSISSAIDGDNDNDKEDDGRTVRTGELRPLSPIKPLSPIGF